MARYYFDMRDGDELALDEEGMELSEFREVQTEAAMSLADMARDTIRRRRGQANRHHMAIEVRDKSGPVMQAKFTFDITKG
jgi:uncharacterized protein DUF6894